MTTEELWGFLHKFIGQGGGGYKHLRKLAPYLYETWYGDFDEGYARRYFKSKKPVFGDLSKSLHRGVPGCSSIIKGSLHGRNFDFLFNECAGFVVHTDAKDGRYATLGVGGQIAKLTQAFVDSKQADDIYKIVPYMITDGINSAGLTVTTLVVPDKDHINKEVTPNGEVLDEICTLALPRYVLDNFSDPQAVVDYFSNSVKLYHPQEIVDMGYSQHFMVGNSSVTYLIEFVNGNYVTYSMANPYATNFILDGVILNGDGTVYTPESKPSDQQPSIVNNLGIYSSGLERYNMMASEYTNINDKQAMERLMLDMRYTRSYITSPNPSSPYWYTEFVGNGSLTVDSDPADFVDTAVQAGQKFENRSRDPESVNYGTWQTVHTAVYDLGALTLDLYAQESDTKFSFNLEV